MKRKIVSGIMLTLLFIGMLTLAFNVPPIVADKGIIGRLNECSTFQDSFLYDGYKNDGFDRLIDDDKWNFNETIEWADFAKVDGDSAELVIGVNNGKSNSYAEMGRLITENGGNFANTVSMGGVIRAVVADVPLVAVSSFVTEVRAAGLSRYIEPNMKFQANFIPNDPYWPQQWGPRKIEADYGWNTTIGDPLVLVAVIDTGIDWDHPDLAANYVALGYDWVNNDTDPMDDEGHGTHCAGIIAAALNNSIGIAGLAQVSIMAEKGLDQDGGGYEDDLANAIIHAVDQGVDIISMSWGGYFHSELIYDAIEYAYDAGVLLVAAAGNEASSLKLYPAAYHEVIAVTATEQFDAPALFTNYGQWVELAAPGVDIISTVWNDSYTSMDGTSMSTPHVSGVAALIWSQFPNKTSNWVRARLRYTADDLGDPGFDEYYGYGRVNARRAVQEALAEHDIVVINLESPPYVVPMGFTNINGTILNFGIKNESSIQVVLLANGSVVNSTFIGFLASNASAMVSVTWNPTVEGIYNVTLYAVPMPGETNAENNVLCTYIYVRYPQGLIYIRSDGSIDPPSAPIQRVGDIYTFTGNIFYGSIVVQRDNITIDGNGYTLQGGAPCNPPEYDYGFNVTGRSNITIKNTRIEYYKYYAIGLRYSDNNTILGNTITNNGWSIYLYNSDSIITGNYITKIFYGIWLIESNSVTVTSNTVTEILNRGIFLSSSNGNVIDGNNVTNSGFGIWLQSSDGNSVSNNTVTNTGFDGIDLIDSIDNRVENNNVSSNYYDGIWLMNSNASTIKSNTMINNRWSGVAITYSNENFIIGNNITLNMEEGVRLLYSNGTTIRDNTVANNGLYGVWLYGSGGNLIFNNFFFNPFNARDTGFNYWNITKTLCTNIAGGPYLGGNLWSDYTGWDVDKDGIGDTNLPYNSDGDITHGGDWLPLTLVFRDVAIINVTPSKTVVGQGYNVSINVIVFNQGDYTEDFNVTVYANTTIIDTVTDISLTSGNFTTITFKWNTTGFAKGNYTISAYAHPVPGETDTTDNRCTDGIVRVNMVGDLTNDGKVNIKDIVTVALAFGSKPGDPNWNPIADINDDGTVNIKDIVTVAIHYGEEDP